MTLGKQNLRQITRWHQWGRYTGHIAAWGYSNRFAAGIACMNDLRVRGGGRGTGQDGDDLFGSAIHLPLRGHKMIGADVDVHAWPRQRFHRKAKVKPTAGFCRAIQHNIKTRLLKLLPQRAHDLQRRQPRRLQPPHCATHCALDIHQRHGSLGIDPGWGSIDIRVRIAFNRQARRSRKA